MIICHLKSEWKHQILAVRTSRSYSLVLYFTDSPSFHWAQKWSMSLLSFALSNALLLLSSEARSPGSPFFCNREYPDAIFAVITLLISYKLGHAFNWHRSNQNLLHMVQHWLIFLQYSTLSWQSSWRLCLWITCYCYELRHTFYRYRSDQCLFDMVQYRLVFSLENRTQCCQSSWPFATKYIQEKFSSAMRCFLSDNVLKFIGSEYLFFLHLLH